MSSSYWDPRFVFSEQPVGGSRPKISNRKQSGQSAEVLPNYPDQNAPKERLSLSLAEVFLALAPGENRVVECAPVLADIFPVRPEPPQKISLQ